MANDMKRAVETCALVLLMLHLLPGQEIGSFEVVGKVLQSDGQPFAQVTPIVFLDCATSPFALRTSANRNGEFRLKGVPAGTYTIIVHVPRVGELRKTIEVGPSSADDNGRIIVDLRVERTLAEDQEHTVTAAQLSIPADAKKQYLKAMAHLERKEVEPAIDSLQKAVAVAPQFVEAWNHLGTIAYTTHRYADAEKYFRSALERDPEAYSPLVNLGGALLALERTQESLAVNQQAVRLKPDDPLAHSQLGMSYYFLGQYDQAESHLKRAKSLDPGHFTLPQLLLAAIYERRKEIPSAISELEDFLKLHPDSDRVPWVRSKVEALRGSLKTSRPIR